MILLGIILGLSTHVHLVQEFTYKAGCSNAAKVNPDGSAPFQVGRGIRRLQAQGPQPEWNRKRREK